MIVDCQKHKDNVFLSTVHSQVKNSGLLQVVQKYSERVKNGGSFRGWWWRHSVVVALPHGVEAALQLVVSVEGGEEGGFVQTAEDISAAERVQLPQDVSASQRVEAAQDVAAAEAVQSSGLCKTNWERL